MPRFYNDGRKIETEKFLETGEELAKRFGGRNFMPPFSGTWINPKDGREYVESNRSFCIDVPNSEESLKFFKEYKETLEKRFQQEEIKITYYPVSEV